MTNFILRNRWIIIIVSVLLAFAGIAMMPLMKTDPEIKNYIPETITSRINTDLIEKEFGDQDMIMILFRDSCVITGETLERIKAIDRQLGRMSYINNTISLFSIKRIYGKDGIMYVEPAVPQIPRTREEERSLMASLRDNPLAMGVAVSDDFSTAAIAATIGVEIPEEELLARVDSVVSMYPGRAKVMYGGLPYVRKYILEDVRKDGIILIPLALAIMLVFLWVAFREWKGMILPFTVVAISIAVSMGLAPLLGWKLTFMSLLVPIILIAVANDYGIHMIAKYQEVLSNGVKTDMNSIVKEVLRDLRKPVIFTGLTTIAGILGLLTHTMIPAHHVGILTAVGVAIAILLTLYLLPAWLSMLKPAKHLRNVKKGNARFVDRFLGWSARTVIAKPVMVLGISLVLTLIFGAGIFLIKVDSNQENLFPANHPVKISSNIINEEFGGSQNISVMAEGDFLEPENLKTLENWSEQLEKRSGVGKVFTIATVIKEMSKAIYNTNEPGYNAIPDSRKAVAQLIELYNMSGDPEDFNRLVNFDYTKAHILIRLNDPETPVVNDLLGFIDKLSYSSPLKTTTGGYAYIMSEFSEKIVKGQITSMIFAIVVVMILLAVIFRSVKGGMISVVPILASLVFLLGFMGLTGISLNPATALLSSIMIGVGVDYTIHFLWRYRKELRSSGYSEAVYTTLSTTGRGIIFNALSVMVGFSVLVFSRFTSLRFFGYLVLISIGVCLISAVYIIPSIMLVFKPAFAEPVELKKEKNNTKMIRDFFKKAVMSVIILLSAVVLQGQEPDGAEIMSKSRSVMTVNAFEAVSELNITDSRGNTRERTNITASKSYPDGTEKRLIKFLAPPDVAGTSILIYDYEKGQDDMWIYLPALKKTRRIISSDKGKSFMGSEFSNTDMSAPPIDDFNHRLLPADADNSEWIVESVPADDRKEDEYGYSRKVSYISRDTYTLKKIEFYNFDNELYKVIKVEAIENAGNGKFIIRRMTAENLLNGKSSEIKMDNIRTGAEIDDNLFDINTLGR